MNAPFLRMLRFAKVARSLRVLKRHWGGMKRWILGKIPGKVGKLWGRWLVIEDVDPFDKMDDEVL